jgi:hypothetical protein
VEELKKSRNISVSIHNLPTKVPKGTNIHKTIGLSVIIIHVASTIAGIRWYNLQEPLPARALSIMSPYLRVKV